MATSKVLSEALSFVPQGYLFGLTMSTAGASTTLTVAPGFACDSTGLRIMKLAAAMAKTTSAWAAGTAAGGLDTGAIAINTWYHWFQIMNVSTGAVDIVFSATATPAAGPTTMPSGYTLFRRIGSMKTNASSQWTAFKQFNDGFYLNASVQDSSTIPTTTDAVYTLASVPTGIRVRPFINVNCGLSSSGAIGVHVRSVDLQPSEACGGPGGGAGPTTAALDNTSARINVGYVDIWTNILAQVSIVATSTGTFFNLVTSGWADDRGKLS